MFVHDAILEAVMTGNTDISVHTLKESLRKLDQIEHDSKVSGFEKKWKVWCITLKEEFIYANNEQLTNK